MAVMVMFSLLSIILCRASSPFWDFLSKISISTLVSITIIFCVQSLKRRFLRGFFLCL